MSSVGCDDKALGLGRDEQAAAPGRECNGLAALILGRRADARWIESKPLSKCRSARSPAFWIRVSDTSTMTIPAHWMSSVRRAALYAVSRSRPASRALARPDLASA